MLGVRQCRWTTITKVALPLYAQLAYAQPSQIAPSSTTQAQQVERAHDAGAVGAAAPTPSDDGEVFDFGRALAEGGEPLSAAQVAARAVRVAPSVAKAKAAAEEARHAATQSVVALYPRLELIAQYTRLSNPPLIVYPLPDGLVPGFSSVAFPTPLADQYLLQARASYPVSDLFFTILPRYRAAQENVRAQKLSVRAAAFSVALLAREAYYNYARARAAKLVATFNASQAQAQLKDVRLRVRTGTQPPVEETRAEANLAAARVGVARAKNALGVARTALRSLLHLCGDADVAVTEDLTQLPSPLTESKEQLLREAFRQRSELRALELSAGAQAREVGASEAEGYPRLSIGASAEEGNPNQRAATFRREWTATWEAMVTLSWSPNDFGASDAHADQVQAQRAQTLADLSALQEALRREVSQAYEDYEAAREAMDAALAGIAAAQESYRVRRAQFRAETAVAIDVILSQGELNRARLDLINAAIDLRIARARLDRAVERGDADWNAVLGTGPKPRTASAAPNGGLRAAPGQR